MKTVLFFIFTFLLAGCVTPMVERFSKIELGMDKSDVLEEVGSPLRTYRLNDQDVWLYNFQTEDTLEDREISFKNSFVTYVGAPRPRDQKSSIKTEEDAQEQIKSELQKNP